MGSARVNAGHWRRARRADPELGTIARHIWSDFSFHAATARVTWHRMTVADPFLKLQGIEKDYVLPGQPALTVLAGIDLELHRGESLAIVGPSGSGKSTLLQIIGTLDQPTRGQVLLDGRALETLDQDEVALVRNRQMGFIFQAHHLLPQCTVLENVLLPTLPCTNEVLRDGAPERARRLLNRVGLGERLKHRPAQLSGGERQRVAVVRALINEPRLLLADEPTGALDRASAANLGRLLSELNREMGVTLVMVTHSLDLAACLQRVMELRDGRLHPVDLSTGKSQTGS